MARFTRSQAGQLARFRWNMARARMWYRAAMQAKQPGLRAKDWQKANAYYMAARAIRESHFDPRKNYRPVV